MPKWKIRVLKKSSQYTSGWEEEFDNEDDFISRLDVFTNDEESSFRYGKDQIEVDFYPDDSKFILIQIVNGGVNSVKSNIPDATAYIVDYDCEYMVVDKFNVISKEGEVECL